MRQDNNWGVTDGLAPEDALAVGWRPAAIRVLVLAPGDQEIVSFTDFHRLGLGLPLQPFV
jgi:hypothetical protein